MPKFAIDLADTYKTVVRPVCMDAIRQVMKNTGIPSDTDILLNDEKNRALSTDAVDFGNGKKLIVRATAEYDLDAILTTPVYKENWKPLFHDPEIGVKVSPVYGDAKLTMETIYRARDRASAEEWLNGIMRKVAQGVEERMHSAGYYYILPNPVLALIHEVHRLREAQAGYGEDLSTYLEGRLDERVTKMVNAVGENARLAVREQQHGLIGYFNFDTLPTLDVGDDGDVWTASFNYTLNFERIVSVTVEYPILIHNQALGHEYVDWNVNLNIELEDLLSSLYRKNLNTIHKPMIPLSTVEGWRVPQNDEWLPKRKPRWTTTVVSIALLIDPNNPTELTNIASVDGYEWSQGTLEYMQRNYANLPNHLKSVIHLTLYEDDVRMDETVLSVDEDLNVTATESLDLRKRYHLTIGMVTDLTLLTEETIDWLLLNGDFAEYFLAVLDPSLLHNGKMPKLIDSQTGPRMPKKAFWDTVANIRTTHETYRNAKRVLMFTVANFLIKTS